MSAFMVSDKTISSITNYLAQHRGDVIHQAGVDVLDEDYKTTFGQLLLDLNAQAFGQLLLDLNAKGVNAGYSDGQAAELRSLTYTPVPAYQLTDDVISVVKYMTCWLYQCSEGDVPESPLYKLMETTRDQLAFRALSSTKAYDLADAWD